MNHLDEFQLNEYLDGMLDPASQSAIEAHLTACNTCQAALDDLQAVFLMLDEVDEVALTTDLSARVLAEWQTQSQPESAAWLRPLLFLQGAGAIGMVVWLWPVIGGWLVGMETAVATTLSTFPPIQFDLWSRLLEWETAVSQQFQLVRPTIDLAAGQWALLIGLALIAWLAGNKFLLTIE
jgi:anti-sigma factor RsiW